LADKGALEACKFEMVNSVSYTKGPRNHISRKILWRIFNNHDAGTLNTHIESRNGELVHAGGRNRRVKGLISKNTIKQHEREEALTIKIYMEEYALYNNRLDSYNRGNLYL
jgi:hypothetical protein